MGLGSSNDFFNEWYDVAKFEDDRGGFNSDPMAALGTAFAVLAFGYGIYWIFNCRKSGKSN